MAERRLHATQPAGFAFTAENAEWAKAQIAKFPEGRQASAVIPLLWRAQEQHDGWLPEPAIRAVADMLGMAYIRALEVATFYSMFQLAPVGRTAHIQVCGTTPCMLRGSGELIEICQRRIHHDPHHLSSDGAFSWEEMECLGACVNAPMIQIGADTFEDLTAASFEKLIDDLWAGRPVRPGPQIDRQLSAPVGGPTTLTERSLYEPAAPAAEETGSAGGAPLTDAEAKKPGEEASLREAPVPKPPGADNPEEKKPTSVSNN
jgi:NADH-quinone oxidoreductase subunit E